MDTKLRKPINLKLRNQVLNRDKQCLRCGSKNNLEIHHIDENPLNNNIFNLVVLCKRCHRPFHSHLCTKYFLISKEGEEYVDYAFELLGLTKQEFMN